MEFLTRPCKTATKIVLKNRRAEQKNKKKFFLILTSSVYLTEFFSYEVKKRAYELEIGITFDFTNKKSQTTILNAIRKLQVFLYAFITVHSKIWLEILILCKQFIYMYKNKLFFKHSYL